MGSPAGRPLPPLRPARRSGTDLPPAPEAPTWSPLVVALPLFAVAWLCFGLLAATVDTPPALDVARLANVLSVGVAVAALVLLTLSVALTQVSGTSWGDSTPPSSASCLAIEYISAVTPSLRS